MPALLLLQKTQTNPRWPSQRFAGDPTAINTFSSRTPKTPEKVTIPKGNHFKKKPFHHGREKVFSIYWLSWSGCVWPYRRRRRRSKATRGANLSSAITNAWWLDRDLQVASTVVGWAQAHQGVQHCGRTRSSSSQLKRRSTAPSSCRLSATSARPTKCWSMQTSIYQRF